MSHNQAQEVNQAHEREDRDDGHGGRRRDGHNHGGHGHEDDHQHHNKEYFVDIEGVLHAWNRSTITFEEIVQLGGWDASQGVVEIDKDNNERTLHPGDVVELKPGHGFSKKVRWKRG